MNFKKNRIFNVISTAVIVSTILVQNPLLTFATSDYKAEAEARKSLAIQSNEIENWPAGPAIGAESAILMDADSGSILYAKNINEQLYPASTTKLLTGLLAAELSSMDDIVTFSRNAVFSIEPGSSNMGMDQGQQITMEQALYGLFVGSANEAANAIAEHISGSVEEFSTLMNERAKSLGCKNTNFVNPNGLYDDNHHTSAYDLALIGCTFFQNELLCKMSNASTYQILPTATQPDDIILHSKNKLLPNREFAFDSLVGSKTGFTSEARQTLISCARKDGLTLICVILKEESPAQFSDTITLFDYGFENFQKVSISEKETQYSIDSTDFFNANSDVFGSSKPIFSIKENAYIVLPNTAVFEDTKSSLSYDDTDENMVAKIDYTYNSTPVGSVSIDLILNNKNNLSFEASTIQAEEVDVPQTEDTLFINITKVFLWVIGIAGVLIGIFVVHSLIDNYQFSKRRNSRSRRRKRKPLPSDFDDYTF